MQGKESGTQAEVGARRGTAVAGYLLGGQLAVAAFALVVNVFAARTMGPGGRGELAVFLQAGYLLTVIGLAGIDRAYPASVSSRVPLSSAIWEVRSLIIVPSSIAMGCAAILAIYLADDGTPMIAAAGLAVLTLGNIATTGLRAASSASSSGVLYLCVNLAAQGSLLVVSVLLAFADFGSPSIWIVAYAACVSVPSLGAAAFLGRRNRSGDKREVASRLATVRSLGFKVIPSTVASMIALRADRLLLPWLAGYEQLGLYIIVATLCEFVVWPAQAWVDGHMPIWNRMHKAGTLRPTWIIIGSLVYAGAASITMIVAFRAVIVPIFGTQYAASITLIVPLAVGSSLYAVSRVAAGLALAADSPFSATATDISCMLVSVASYALLIPTWGAMGAAVGSLCGCAIAAAISIPIAFRTCKRRRSI